MNRRVRGMRSRRAGEQGSRGAGEMRSRGEREKFLTPSPHPLISSPESKISTVVSTTFRKTFLM
jgi:hypothetical protein